MFLSRGCNFSSCFENKASSAMMDWCTYWSHADLYDMCIMSFMVVLFSYNMINLDVLHCTYYSGPSTHPRLHSLASLLQLHKRRRFMKASLSYLTGDSPHTTVCTITTVRAWLCARYLCFFCTITLDPRLHLCGLCVALDLHKPGCCCAREESKHYIREESFL